MNTKTQNPGSKDVIISSDIEIASFIAIGASAGGVNAVRTILKMLNPTDDRVPIGVVQHLPAQARLDVGLIYGSRGANHILEVEDKMPIEPGCVYMAAPGYHLLIEEDETFALSQDEPVLHSRPSIDVFFESVAQVYKNSCVGILLTGANSDGAKGLKDIAKMGGYTIVQDPSEAECAVMPQSAIHLNKPNRIYSLHEIANFISSLAYSSLERAP